MPVLRSRLFVVHLTGITANSVSFSCTTPLPRACLLLENSDQTETGVTHLQCSSFKYYRMIFIKTQWTQALSVTILLGYCCVVMPYQALVVEDQIG